MSVIINCGQCPEHQAKKEHCKKWGFARHTRREVCTWQYDKQIKKLAKAAGIKVGDIEWDQIDRRVNPELAWAKRA